MALATMIIIIYMNWLQSCLLIIVGRELRISEEKRVSKFHKKQQVLFILTVYNMRICDNCQGAVAFLKQCRMTRGASIPPMICSGAM